MSRDSQHELEGYIHLGMALARELYDTGQVIYLVLVLNFFLYKAETIALAGVAQ